MPNYTTNYNLKKPVGTEYFTKDDINGNMDLIDAQLKAEADAIAGKAPTSHNHTEGDLPDASTSAQGVVQLSDLLTGTSHTKAATEYAAKQINDKAVEIRTWRDTVYVAMQDSPNYFTITMAGITDYAQVPANICIALNAGSDAPNVRVNALAYRAIKNGANNKPVKMDIWGRVRGSFDTSGSFFVEGAGGGIELPATITAGDVGVYSSASVSRLCTGDIYQVIRTITIKQAGTYRFKYDVSDDGSPGSVILAVGGAEVAGSSASSGNDNTVVKVTDVAVTANAVVTLKLKSASSSYYTSNSFFGVSILAADFTTEFAKII